MIKFLKAFIKYAFWTIVLICVIFYFKNHLSVFLSPLSDDKQYNYQEGLKDDSSSSQDERIKDYVVFKSSDIYKMFKNNEIAAEKKLSNYDVLVIYGHADSINIGFLHKLYIVMTDKYQEYPSQYIMALLKDTQEDKASKINTGDFITVECESGSPGLSTPVLKNCELVHIFDSDEENRFIKDLEKLPVDEYVEVDSNGRKLNLIKGSI